jgi:dGTPase
VAEQLWRREALATYATLPWRSRGRLNAEPEGPSRSPFQRDRDRIVHSTAFRRLKHKTQVFVYHEGDHYRTRLTHSLEVAQIARTICTSARNRRGGGARPISATPPGHAGDRHARGDEALAALITPRPWHPHQARGAAPSSTGSTSPGRRSRAR